MSKIDEKLQQLKPQELEVYKRRHSAEHVLMQAMEELGFDIFKAMGPATDDGFYFDFELKSGEPITANDFPKILQKMQEIQERSLPIVREEVSIEQARELFGDNPYKLEWIEEASGRGEALSIYWTGEPKQEGSFVDLCAGPHVENTDQIGAVTLLSIAGAYWRGNENNIMLTRIYGTAFETQKELKDYLAMLEEAKKRDHRKLGQELELFMFHETAPGNPYWLPKGLIILNELIDYWRRYHNRKGYQEIASPLINKKELWEQSGHWDHYKDDMFIADMGENEVYGVKPMNCPNAMVVFGSKIRSYRDLPMKLSDTDMLHRYERAGTLHGLLRVRSFRQDDAHIFLAEDQIHDQFEELFQICEDYYKLFGLNFKYRLGTRPKSFMGDIKTWDKAEATLREILNTKVGEGEYIVAEGDGAFYGPKVDIVMYDAIGRDWQMGTLQLDFQIPQRFNLKYIDAHGTEQSPVVIHRVIYGSLERFIGILLENFGGALPVWLHPTQVAILPINSDLIPYAQSIKDDILLSIPQARIYVDETNESLQKKIRAAQLQKIPYMFIVGKQEQEAGTISLRLRTGEEIRGEQLDQFILSLQQKINLRELAIWE